MSLSEHVAALFRANPNRWIDGQQIARVGGYAAYRTRISDLRRPPYAMTIENRVRTVIDFDEWVRSGATRKIKVSEYRFLPWVTAERAAEARPAQAPETA